MSLGSREAKKVLAVAVHNHYKRILQDGDTFDGAVHQLSPLAEIEMREEQHPADRSDRFGQDAPGTEHSAPDFDVPFCIADATTI